MFDLGREFFIRIMQPGDVLVYARRGFLNTLIELKTYSHVSHVELYLGNGKTSASRNGVGVNAYDFDANGLAYVLRPKSLVDMAGVRAGLARRKGAKYDWFGLYMGFIKRNWSYSNNRYFCSENTTLDLRDGGFEPFAPEDAAASIAPGDFPKSSAFTRLWVRKDLK